MPPAAFIGNPTDHPGVIVGVGCPTVLIGGMPAARVGDQHVCSFPSIVPHPPGVIMPPGSLTVFIGGLPAARVGDRVTCGAMLLPPGCLTVLIGG